MLRASFLVLLSLAAIARAQDGEGLPLPAPKGATKLADVTTDFDPKKDAPLFFNNGDYASPGGDCFGMSLVAIDNYIERQKGAAVKQQDKVTMHPAEGDLKQEETAALVANDALGKDGGAPQLFKPSNPKPVLDALDEMKKTGLPQPFFMDAGKGQGEEGHVTVLYGAKDGKLLFYDPQFPGETIAWPFDPRKGLGVHPKHDDPFSGSYYGHVNGVASVPFDKLRASKDIGAIKQACDAGAAACVDKFPKVTATLAPAKDAGEVELSGTVSRGEKKVNGEPTAPPVLAWVKIDGKLRQQPIKLAKDGSYKVSLPRSAFQDTSEVTVVATTQFGALAGYATQKLSLPSTPGLVKELDKAGSR
jgi:hypothetical protein